MKINYLKEKAVSVRKLGASYKEVAKRLKISKSTAYSWLKDIPLNRKAKEKLNVSQRLGRHKGMAVLKEQREKRDEEIHQKTLLAFTKFKGSILVYKIVCSILYWGEGEKSENKIAFTNSDPLMVRTFLRLFRSSFMINEDKFSAFLHLHDYHIKDEMVCFWAKATGIHKNKIRVYNKKSSHATIKAGYKGCISIRYSDVKISKEIKFLYMLFAEKLNNGGVV
jgi:hypothetical protein